MPQVSIVVPTFNRGPLLLRALLSVERQTHRDYEVIVVDDGSSDGTRERLHQFAHAHPELEARLVYVELPRRGGANVARNEGLRRAQAAWVAFLDSDDLWHPQKLERQLAAIRAEAGTGPWLSYTGRYRVDSHYDIIACQLPGAKRDERARILEANVIGTLSSVLVDTDLARRIGGFDEQLEGCQDWDFYVRALREGSVSAVREPLIMYYDSSESRISHDRRRKLRAHLAMYRKHMRGKLLPERLGPLYRSIAEDLEELGRARWAERFYVTHLWRRGSYLRSVAYALGVHGVRIAEERYRRYAAQEQRRDKSRDSLYLDAFRALLAQPL